MEVRRPLFSVPPVVTATPDQDFAEQLLVALRAEALPGMDTELDPHLSIKVLAGGLLGFVSAAGIAVGVLRRARRKTAA